MKANLFLSQCLAVILTGSVLSATTGLESSASTSPQKVVSIVGKLPLKTPSSSTYTSSLLENGGSTRFYKSGKVSRQDKLRKDGSLECATHMYESGETVVFHYGKDEQLRHVKVYNKDGLLQGAWGDRFWSIWDNFSAVVDTLKPGFSSHKWSDAAKATLLFNVM
jgi:hypothetical protein